MPQDYTVLKWEAWPDKQNGGQPTQDNYGNFKGSLYLQGLTEAVDATFKNPPTEGVSLYGHVEPYQTRSGSTRQRFKRDQKEQFAGMAGGFSRPQASITPGVPAKPAYKDNSDGMRQGLSANIANAYVTAMSQAKDEWLDAEQWALTVKEYARAYYEHSELGMSGDQDG